jgi:alpha-tubulin suppressor-like RCC1 family protein
VAATAVAVASGRGQSRRSLWPALSSRGVAGSASTSPTATTGGGTIYTKGSGLFGALGRGDLYDAQEFMKVSHCEGLPEDVTYTSISAGWGHTAAVTNSGDLVVMGRPFDLDALLRLNNIKKVSSWLARALTSTVFNADKLSGIFKSPVVYIRGGNIVQASCSAGFTLVLSAEGKVSAFGSNRWGQCGRHAEHKESLMLEPQTIPLPNPVVAVDTGLQNCIALDNTGDVYCWGKGHKGQIGSELDGEYVHNPVRVGTIKDIIAISAGFGHCAAVDVHGALYVWGKGSSEVERECKYHT